MQSPDRITGLALAALVLGDRDQACLSSELSAGLDARLAGLAAEPSRETALATLARAAGAPLLDALPAVPRAAALLAPVASPLARARAGSLPSPRRGYRPPPGLQDHLRRLATAATRTSFVERERARAEERSWPA